MDWRVFWTRKLEEAGRELDTARGRTAINAASKKLQEARRELKRLDEQERKAKPKRRATSSRTRGRASS